MLSLISPAKSQDFSNNVPTDKATDVLFKNEITQLVQKLKHYSPDQFETLMKISPKLAEKVFDMYVNFDNQNYTKANAKQALFAFTGDVYRGLDTLSLTANQLDYAQNHVLMISGLYGLIRPLDLIQAYRLEMGVKFYIDNLLLYDFWRAKLTTKLNEIIATSEHKVIVNLASNEYSKVIDQKAIHATWLEVDFKEHHMNKYQTIALFAKRARGRMVRFILDHRINTIDGLKAFDYDGYTFNSELSHTYLLCFTRVKP
ncbi:peroxide stress protein YaaA [Fastidiosibacter lacustris]|uniref:peroxide stress protein YaaA n=1 Tax=Fastidiosibacter lacustris TaxID=2056695 RepID=UPI000E35339D|nr:peroxide stress protein YaaA [Fastidiosibacter lacustris]